MSAAGEAARTLEPTSVDEAQELLRGLARDRQSVLFVGGGTELGLGAAVATDAVLKTGKLDRIVEYAPSDQVVTVEAGVTLAALQQELAKHGQRLALDPPLPERATLGGIVAANSFGPLRARFGSVRDLIIGVSIIRADGARAKGGGKVVKTVAGFDLPKLMCSSLGTLGLIATATFRVHPLPEAAASLALSDLSAADVNRVVLAMRGAQLEPAALLATRTAPGRYALAVRFEGFGKGVEQQEARLRALAAFDSAPQAPDLWAAHAAARTHGEVRLKLAALPTALPQVEAALAGFPDAQLAWYPTLGLGFVSIARPNDAVLESALGGARRALAVLGGSLVVLSSGSRKLDPWGPPPGALALHQAVKNRFDPDGLLAPGRFVGGI